MIAFLKFLHLGDAERRWLFTDNPIILHAVQMYSELSNPTFFAKITLHPEETLQTLEGKFVNNECILDLSQYLSAYVSLQIPDLADADIQYSKLGKKTFSLVWGLKNEAGEIVFLDETLLLNGFDAFLGGFYREQYPSPPRFFTLLSQNLSVRKIKPEHLDYEYYYCTGISGNITFTYFIYNQVGAVVTNFISVPTYFEDGNWIIITPLKKILESVDVSQAWRVVIKIKDNLLDNEQIITYELDRTIRRNERLFIFQNSLGGMDTVCFTGERTKTVEVEHKTAEKNLDYRYKKSDSRKLNFKTESQTGFKMETGYKTRVELDYLQREFLSSPQIYEIVDNQILAISLTTKKLDYEQNSVKPQSASFEYFYSL